MSESQRLLERLFALHPKRIDLSLGRIRRLLEKLGRPDLKLPPVFHIAGTNGKGSVAAFLLAFLESEGRRVHAYTSPHLIRFHERIRLSEGAGVSLPISERRLVQSLEEVIAANDGDPITFFEATSAAAFLSFAAIPADFLILETGLGGRLDATNILEKPAATIITPVSLDHQSYLGRTIGKIAFEKAGIIKPHSPLFCAKQPRQAAEVIARRAEETGAPLFMEGRDWQLCRKKDAMIYRENEKEWRLPLPALLGDHQMRNAGIAIRALRGARGILAMEEAAPFAKGLRAARNPGRLQPLKSEGGLEIWLDGAHNPQAARAIAKEFRAMRCRHAPKPLHLLCGMGRAKDAALFFRAFRGVADKIHAVPVRRNPLAEAGSYYDPSFLAEIAAGEGFLSRAHASLDAALQSLAQEEKEARLLICGSLHLAGEILEKRGGAARRLDAGRRVLTRWIRASP